MIMICMSCMIKSQCAYTFGLGALTLDSCLPSDEWMACFIESRHMPLLSLPEELSRGSKLQVLFLASAEILLMQTDMVSGCGTCNKLFQFRH